MSASRGGTSVSGSRGGGTATGSRGGSVTYGGAKGGVKGPNGGAAGGIGGVKVEGPRGNTASKGGAGGIASGSSGTAAGRAGGAKVEGSRGNTATRGGAGGIASGSSGTAAGRVGGSSISTPGGRTVSRGGASGAVAGRGGVAGGRVGGGSVSGARGSVSGAAGRGFASDGGFARYRGGAAVRGPNGGVAAGHRTVAVSRGSLHGRGVAVRGSFYGRHPGCGSWFRPGWYAHYPNAWRAARWTTAGVWAATSWNAWHQWWGWPVSGAAAQPVYYDYGNTTVYEGDVVYQGGEQIATADEYYEQATEIAASGQEDAQITEDDEWQSFGVFGLVQGDETEADKILQIGANKNGVLRGNYFDALTETTLTVEGSVDPETQRAAWTVGDNKNVVYETGVGDLTNDESTLLIHFGKDKTQQWTMVRLEEPEDSQ